MDLAAKSINKWIKDHWIHPKSEVILLNLPRQVQSLVNFDTKISVIDQ